MTIGTWAVVEGGVVTNMVVAPAYYGAIKGWVEVGASVSPSAGWAYDVTTKVWTAPPPAAVSAQQAAKGTVQTLAATLPAQLTQAQTDATTIAGMVAGQPLTSEQVAAIQRHAAGWPQLLEVLGAIVTAAGLI